MLCTQFALKIFFSQLNRTFLVSQISSSPVVGLLAGTGEALLCFLLCYICGYRVVSRIKSWLNLCCVRVCLAWLVTVRLFNLVRGGCHGRFRYKITCCIEFGQLACQAWLWIAKSFRLIYSYLLVIVRSGPALRFMGP